ncbi:hypothetical protein TNCV_1270021 [Trichonephila clavipes]|nr:hypothetical protein TNCV_1270021 [Trichonephila clavipes]
MFILGRLLFDTSCYLDLIVPSNIFFLSVDLFLFSCGQSNLLMEERNRPWSPRECLLQPPGGDRLSEATTLGTVFYGSNNDVMEIIKRKYQYRQNTFQLPFSVVEVFVFLVNNVPKLWLEFNSHKKLIKNGTCCERNG